MASSPSVLVSDQGSQLLTSLSDKLGISPTLIPIKHFADTETYIPFKAATTFENKDVLVVFHFFQSGRPETVNQRLLQLMILIDFITVRGARSVQIVLPYLAYGRQSRDYFEELRGPLHVIFSMLKALGVQRIFSADIHESDVLSLFEGQLMSVSMHHFWAEAIKTKCAQTLDNLVIVSPDVGGVDRVRVVAELLGVPFCHVEKQRIAPDTSTAQHIIGDVAGKDVVILDDILSTASTALAAGEMLAEQGARSIVGCFTHGLFCDDAHSRINNSQISKVYFTDTIAHGAGEFYDKETVVSCADFLSAAICKELHDSAE